MIGNQTRNGGNGLAWAIVLIAIIIILLIVFMGGDNEDTDNGDTAEMESIMVELSSLNDSNITGTAVIEKVTSESDNTSDENEEVMEEESDEAMEEDSMESVNQTRVTLNLVGNTSTTSRPAHIHAGSCDDLGDVVYPLEGVEGSQSVTLLDVSLEEIKDGLPLAVNVHESEDELGAYIACGDIIVEEDEDGAMNSSDKETDEEAMMEGEEGETDNSMAEEGIAVVTYTDEGFEPQEVSISVGDMVRFVNESGDEMWVASAQHPTHEVYGGTSLSEHCPNEDNTAFDQCQSGDSYEFTFDQEGEWGYHNHVRANDFGKVIVE